VADRGVPKLANNATRLAPTVTCCLAFARKAGVDINLLLRENYSEEGSGGVFTGT
jgi:hypothetical protein